MAWITSTSICNNSYHSFLNLKNAVTTMWITPKNNTVWCNWLYIRKIPNFQYIWRHNKPYLVLMLIQLWSFHNNVLSMINPKNLVLLILVIIVLEAIIWIFISLRFLVKNCKNWCTLHLPILGQCYMIKNHKNGFTYLNYEYFWFPSQRHAFVSCKGLPQILRMVKKVPCMNELGSFPLCQHCHYQTVRIRVVLFSYWKFDKWTGYKFYILNSYTILWVKTWSLTIRK